MKKKTLYSGLIPLMGAVLFSSCGEEVAPGREGMGSIALSVDLDAGLLAADVYSRAAETVTVNDLSMTLTSADGSFSRTWESVSDFSSDEQFPIGNYTIEVSNADRYAEGFDCTPAYYDSQSVKVTEGSVTPVSLTATLAHAMVSVDYSDAFRNYLERASVYVTSSYAGKAIPFQYSSTYTDTDPAYIVPGNVTVKVELTKKNGVSSSGQLLAAEFVAEARHHYHMTLDVNDGGVGEARLKVTFDEEVEAEEVEIDLSDATLTAPAPEMFLEGVEDGELSFVEGCYSGEPVLLSLVARGGIASVKMTTKSTYFRDRCGWAETVELVNTPETDRSKLTTYGFDCKGLWSNPETMAVIDLTKALEQIMYFDGDRYDNVSTFTFSIVDKNGKTTEADLSFAVSVEKMNIELSEPSQLDFFASSVAVDMAFNGTNPAEKVKFSYKNERGIDVALSIADIQDKGNGVYRVTLEGLPEDEKAVTLSASCNGRTASIEVARVPGQFAIETTNGDNDVFAKRAYITVTSEEYDASLVAGLASFWLVGEDGSMTKLAATRVGDSATYMVEGLTPSSSLKVTASLVNSSETVCEPIVLNTEAATQLPNAAMENWYKSLAPTSNEGSGFIKYGANAYIWYAQAEGDNSFWSTRNALTTFTEGGALTPNYVAYSGTLSATGVTGSAAEISTIGYGANSTFMEISGAIIKHKAAGMLFIGEHSASSETSETIEYGKPFESRPAGFSFKYKYAPYNGESFKAYIVVENRSNGEVVELARQELVSSDAVTDFKEAKLMLDYAQSSLKATHMYIVFLSSTLDGIDEPAVTGIKGSKGAFAGYTDARYVGSVLTVDDIELIY